MAGVDAWAAAAADVLTRVRASAHLARMLQWRRRTQLAQLQLRLTEFYSKHNPSQLRFVEVIVRLPMSEQLIFDRLNRKYNVAHAQAVRPPEWHDWQVR